MRGTICAMATKKEDAAFRARQAIEGAKGGNITLGRHGKNFYSKIAKARWKAWRKANPKR